MSFQKIYAETAFTSIGAGRVHPKKLKETILATPAITDVLESIGVANFGTQSADSASATGRTWYIQFAGAGPSLAGGGQAALDAIVAAHTDTYTDTGVAAASITVSGPVTLPVGTVNDGQVFKRLSGQVIGADVPTGSIGAVDNALLRADTVGSGIQSSLITVDDTGLMTQSGTLTGADPLFVGGHSGSGGFKYKVYSRTNTPVGNVTHDPATGMGVCYCSSTSPPAVYFYTGISSGNYEWYRMGTPKQVSGFVLSWSSATVVSITSGVLADSKGQIHSVGSSSFNTATVAAPSGLDTGAFAANTWYYVYLLRNNLGSYSYCISGSPTNPTLTASAFTTNAYAFVERLGSVKTTAVATNFLEFYQTGMGRTKRYISDAASTENNLVTNGTSTTAVTIGYSAGGGAVPITANHAGLKITTNGTASCSIRYSSSVTNVTIGTVPISRTDEQLVTPMSNGTIQYINSLSSGATTINVGWYEEDVLL